MYITIGLVKDKNRDSGLIKVVKGLEIAGGILLCVGTAAFFYYCHKEDKIVEDFNKSQPFLDLDSKYKSQCAAIDTPYVRQHIAIEKAYHFQKDSLKQAYIDSVKVGGK
jgi:hypothetical protein